MNKAVRALAAAATTVLALSGCAQGPSDAAVVGGVSIPESDIELANADFAAMSAADPASTRITVVNSMVLGEVARQLAATNQVPLTDAGRARVLKAAPPAFTTLAEKPGGKALVDALVSYAVVNGQLGEKKMVEGCSRVPVSVNPRYGEWAAEACSLTGASGSLSTPAAATER